MYTSTCICRSDVYIRIQNVCIGWMYTCGCTRMYTSTCITYVYICIHPHAYADIHRHTHTHTRTHTHTHAHAHTRTHTHTHTHTDTRTGTHKKQERAQEGPKESPLLLARNGFAYHRWSVLALAKHSPAPASCRQPEQKQNNQARPRTIHRAHLCRTECWAAGFVPTAQASFACHK